MNARVTDFDRSVRDEGLVCCAVGQETYALRGADVHQLVRVEQLTPAAGGDVLAGTLDLDGESVPVFRLAAVLGRPDTSGAAHGGHIAVTGEPGALVGWLVDRIVRTPLYEGAQVVALPVVVGGHAANWFEAIVRLDDDSVLLLAPRYLNPLADPPARPAAPDGARPLSSSSSAAAGAAEPMILLFSTPALPHCEAPRYALSGRRIAAIAQPLSPIVVPGSAPHVTGVAWWRNAIVPLIDFRVAGDHVDEAQLRRCVIARCGTRLDSALVAFPVNSDIAVHRPSADDRQTAAGSPPDFTLGMFDVDGEAVALLDLDALLAPTQFTTLQVHTSLEELS